MANDISYGTEPAVGKAIKHSGVPRDQIFVTSKLWNNKHSPADVAQALQDTLNDLGLEYLDLFLMHWPVAFKPGDDMFPSDENGKLVTADIDYVDVSIIERQYFICIADSFKTYRAMEDLVKSGKTKAIGISNFSQKEVERLLANSTIVPAIHQMELHPWLQQKGFMKFHQQKGIHVTQFSPFGNQNEIYGSREKYGQLVNDNSLIEIGKKYGKTSTQVALGKNLPTLPRFVVFNQFSIVWGIAHGRSVIPKSKSPERIIQNFDIDFELDPADIKTIDSIDKKVRFNDASKDFGYELFADLDGK